jgi:hypothetical protein
MSRVAVVVAATEPAPAAASSLSRFGDEVRGRGEVILVDGTREGTGLEMLGVRAIRHEARALAPVLWEVGLEATDAPLVAFSTTAMLPRPGWLSALLDRLDATGAAAVGGPIAPGPGLSALDRAVYLHRFVSYLPPVPEPVAQGPPGDNALYRRDRLRGLEPLWSGGFWEATIHRALHGRGETLAFASGAVVEYRGGSRFAPTLRRRIAHARHFGAGRDGRLIRTAAAPAVPAVLLARIARTLRRRGQRAGPWLAALPHLGWLLPAWSLGEVAGAWLGPPPQPCRSQRATSSA